MSWIDAVFLVLVLGVAPPYSAWGYRRLERDLAAGKSIARVHEYLESIVLIWLFGLAAAAIWLGQGRPLEGIGLAAPGGFGLLPSLALTVAVIWFLSAQLARVRRTDKKLEGVEQIESVRAMLPETPHEWRWFVAAVLSAGIFEEILYRGYLIGVLGFHMPLWAAAVVSSAGFAWGHIYQGWERLPTIFLASLGAAGIYLWTGSLLLPMILHAFIDINSGLTARAVLEKQRGAAA